MQIAPAPAETLVEPGSRYTEYEVLGLGGMGKIVLAQDARIGREVAVKQLRADRELVPEERARFLREAQCRGSSSTRRSCRSTTSIAGPTGRRSSRCGACWTDAGDILEDLRHGVPEAVARYTQRELLQAFATVCLAWTTRTAAG